MITASTRLPGSVSSWNTSLEVPSRLRVSAGGCVSPPESEAPEALAAAWKCVDETRAHVTDDELRILAQQLRMTSTRCGS